jgi:hypothetical protein
MKTVSLYSRACLVLIAGFFLMPLAASAATLYMETAPGTVSTGDTIVVKAYLDTDAAPVNALDGSIDLSGSAFSVKTISLADSTLSLWPTTPALSSDGKSINFTGGLPGGFTGTHLLLFSMVLNATSAGSESFTPTDSHLYLNDGKGTATPVSGTALSIAVTPAQPGSTPNNEWQATLSSDTTPPAPFTISEGQDPSVNDGKKYIFFQTTDTQSGVDHYTVQEGNAAPVPSSMTYVLQDQTTPVTVIVSAYDKAGNVRTSTFTTTAVSTTPNIPLMVPILLLAFAVIVAIAYGVWRYTKSTK